MSDREMKDQQDVATQEKNSQPLTTRDMAAGVATGRAREEQEAKQAVSNAQIAPETSAPLFDTGETDGFRSRWKSIQTQFVDEPRRSVEQADELVAQTMKRLAEQEACGLPQRQVRGRTCWRYAARGRGSPLPERRCLPS